MKQMNTKLAEFNSTTQLTSTSFEDITDAVCSADNSTGAVQTLPSTDITQPSPMPGNTSGYVSLVLSFAVFAALLLRE